MKKFSKDLREHASKIIDYEKKKMIPLTTEEKIYHNKQKICYICKKELSNNEKKNCKVRNHCHYMGKYKGAAHNICNLRYKISKEIPIVFHNGSIYDYHFIIKELVKEFEGNFECLGENTEKYITFSVPIKKKIENKDLEITYKIKLIDSYRFMASSLSKLVDNLSEGIHNNKCSDCGSNLDYIKITAGPSSLERKNEKLILECYNCKQRYKKIFNKELIKRFASTYSFCNNDLNKFILLLRKGVYPYEYMDNWERFNETSLPTKESFYSNLNMENIEDIDYRHDNNVFNKILFSKLVSEPNYHTINLISEDLSIIEMKKTKVKMNKPIYLGLSILEISKILMYEFWYDYMKPKYNDNVRLCYMDTDSFVTHIKTNDFYKDIASDVENIFDTSNYEVNTAETTAEPSSLERSALERRPLPTGKNKKVIGLMKDELGGKIITEFVTLRPKTYSFLNGKEDKKVKRTKKCIIKKMIKFNDYKKCLLNGKIILKSQQQMLIK